LSLPAAQYAFRPPGAGPIKPPGTTLIARHTMHSNKSYFAVLLVIVIASALIAKAAVVITGVAV